VASSTKTDPALDALEQALLARNEPKRLTHHSDRGGRYFNIAEDIENRLGVWKSVTRPILGVVGKFIGYTVG
jgi:hypothetical protein